LILGLGTDIVEIARIERAMRRPGFVERILTQAERALGQSPSFVAGRWAAKEAAAKCISVRMSWQDVEVLRGSDGEPVMTCRATPPGSHIWVTISHERAYATATVILEGPRP
jgi:holo-[acyl-carrier protein] synthase